MLLFRFLTDCLSQLEQRFSRVADEHRIDVDEFPTAPACSPYSRDNAAMMSLTSDKRTFSA
jgi:hypothetical protein